MQTKSYTDLLALIQSLIGAGELTTDEQSKILHFVNRRAFEAYSASQSWSRYIVPSEERDIVNLNFSGGAGPNEDNVQINQDYKFIGYNADSVNSVINSEVYQGVTKTDAIIYRFKSGSTQKWYVVTDATVTIGANKKVTVSDVTTPDDLEFSESLTSGVDSVFDAVLTKNSFVGQTGTASITKINVVPYEQLGTNTIGEFIRIHRKEAFNRNSALEYDYFVNAQGAHLLNVTDANPTSAFVTYKKQMTEFSETSTDIPLEFFYYIAHAVYADFLRLESKLEDARSEEAIAQTYLAQELEKIDIRNNNNSLNKKFSTYVNRQSR